MPCGVLDPSWWSHNTDATDVALCVVWNFFAISYSVTQRKLSEEVIQDWEELVSDPKKFY